MMSIYPIPELLHLWTIGDLTAEQAVGQLIQYLKQLTQQQTELEKRIRLLEQQQRKEKL